MDIDKLILDKIIPMNFHRNSEWDSIIKMLLIAGIARNIFAHDHASIHNIRNETCLYLLYNSVVSIWFAWNNVIRINEG